MALARLYDLLFSTTNNDTPTTRAAPLATPSAVPQLPLEVVITILEEIDAPELNPCALVCRAWSLPAQKLLFRNVVLASRASCTSFLAAVDRTTPHGRALGDAVQRLRVVLDHNQPFGVSEGAFAHAVSACPNLLELDLALYGCASPGKDVVGFPDELRIRRPAPSFNDTTVAQLRAGPRIRSLHFSNWSENHASIVQLLDIWPTITSLAVSGSPPALPPASLPPFPAELQQLRMNCQPAPSVDFLKWLLHSSAQAGSLQSLMLEREAPSEVLEHLVDAHCGSLRALSLPACTTHDHARAVHKCERLRELRVEQPWVTPVLYKRLPADVEHLALAIDQDTGLQPVLETVRAAEALKAVTFQVWDSGARNPQLPVLKLACAFRGIELKITKDIRVFRAAVRGDIPAVPQPIEK